MPEPIQPIAPAAVPVEVPTTPVAPAPVPTPLAEPVQPTTPVGQPPVDPNAAPVPNGWGDDWREKLVGDVTTDDGKKRLTQLQRLADPKAMFEKLVNQEKLISSGQLKKNLPDSPSPEELATYRAENDIPESSDKYDLTLDDGVVMGEQDKPIVDAVLKELHGVNMPQAMVKTMLNTFFKAREQEVAERDLKDEDYKTETAGLLRTDWGSDYTPNLHLIKNLIGTAPADAQDGILNARMPDGRPLLSHPGALRWLATAARQINPVSTVVPGASDPTAAIETELATLKGMMGDKNTAYWKGADANKNQARYRELLDAQQRYK